MVIVRSAPHDIASHGPSSFHVNRLAQLGASSHTICLHPKALLDFPIPSQRQNLTEGIIRSVPKRVQREKQIPKHSLTSHDGRRQSRSIVLHLLNPADKITVP